MEESISGFKVRGAWDEVVEHGERITQALRQEDIEEQPEEIQEAFADWDEWRPKAHERLNTDVSEKTADQASVDEGEGEKVGKAASDDVKKAGEKLSESYKKMEDGDDEGAVERWQDSIGYVTRAADSAGRKALRTVENTVYRNVMTQLAPYYFDNALISANLQQPSRGGDDEELFVFEVNINDDDLKEAVSERLGEYEDTIDRWHVTTEKETDTVEAAEGVETPDQSGDDTQSTTN
ncbi:hypothetical protein EGH24_07760 [Halonotius terrestris]|uniref:Uncharacterized protein n=1 Tax=Halonotius terrestris TaxID=2487750 RepID=A0A8J8TCN0_9EURY|nr:DUF5828 family protein [Halonotius terrestris]TQQ81036.1 hypothetical protein EGH24_07760 [Halonotius terrestris]